MRRSTTLLYDVPAEVAFDYLSDPTHRPEWQSSLRRVEVLDPGPAHDGQRWLDHTAVGLVAAMRTTAYAPATEWSETGTWRGIAADLTLRFEPHGSGCRVHAEFSVHGRGAWSAIGVAATTVGLPAVRADLATAGRILSERHHP
ncbi:Polyketide cyclase / dehydrase and lipid transport [Nocardioides scoriae]|uniref:Polyketide cyclase / dehydrase and lipid transport n=1 Tax=Nocardioides scoriae TaxID=642780 RepID=A0A1H1WMN9_9ACTN|nr:SRPBCC family protein [Nocardioides scoriae]SDS98324.1 Polyketide cyclase / dehydrase and lipid transport [Nocardioides scoriae]